MKLLEEYVTMRMRNNRGWPVPESSWGLDSLYGEAGWCKSCGMPLIEQVGALRLQRRGLAKVPDVWMPNWRFDVICVSESLVEPLSSFPVDLRDVEWSNGDLAPFKQLVFPTIQPHWFEPNRLRERLERVHGVAGAECKACDRWRWMPLKPGEFPDVLGMDGWMGRHFVGASPEWFGDGWVCFREFAMLREIGELLYRNSPREFSLAALSSA